MGTQFSGEDGAKMAGWLSLAGVAIKTTYDRLNVGKRLDKVEDKTDHMKEKLDNLDGYIRGKLGD